MKHINDLLEHLMESAEIEGDEDLQLCIQIILGAMEKNMVGELSDDMLKFCVRKATERQMKEN